MQLPLIDDPKLAQTKWKSILDPLLAKPFSSGQILTGVSLISGDNIINHKLGRKLQGWIISDITAAVQIFRSAPLNETTLTLNSSGSAIVNIFVF